MTVNASYGGRFNFIAELQNSGGQSIELLSNTIGASSSSKAFRVPTTGEYIVNVSAAMGPWKLEFVPIGPAEQQSAILLPQTFKGTGNQNTPLVIGNAGALFVAGTHNGQRNFIVDVLDVRGQKVGLAANAIGATSTTQSIRLPATGIYVFNVTADGDWTIEAK